MFDYLRTSFTTIQSMGWKVSTLVIRVYQNVVQKLIPHQMDQHFTSCFGHSHALQTLMVKMIMNLIILLFTMLPCYNRSLIVQRMLLKQSMDHSNWSLIQVHQSIAFVPKHCSLPSRNGIQTFLYALRMVRKWLSRPLEMLSFKWLIKMALPVMLFCMTVCTYHLSIPIFYQSNNWRATTSHDGSSEPK